MHFFTKVYTFHGSGILLFAASLSWQWFARRAEEDIRGVVYTAAARGGWKCPRERSPGARRG
jgi:hypothetical protein